MDNENYEYEEKIDKQLMQKSQIDSADDKNDSIEYHTYYLKPLT